MIGPVHPIQPSFAAGELSPPVRSRVDLDKRDIGLEVCKNFITRPHGGAVNRPGFEFYGETKNSSKRSRLIPFVFSMDASECYAMEVGDQYVRFYTSDGLVVTEDVTPVPYEVTTPFLEADIGDIRYVQSADVMYLTHPDYPIMTLSRYGHIDWLLEEFPFSGGPFQDVNEDEDITVSMNGFAQKAYPASDYASGSWATTPLYSKLDEEPYNDSDYISCAGLGTECKLTLSTLEEPTSRSGHVLKVRAKGNRTSTKLRVRLYSGTTQIYEKTIFLTTAWGAYNFEIPENVAEQITSYATVRVGLYVSSYNTYTGYVSWVCLQTPKGSSGGGVEVTEGPFNSGDSVIIEASDPIFESDMEGCLFMAEYLTPGSSVQVQIPDSVDYTSPEYRVRGKWNFRTTSGGDWDASTIYLDKSIDDGKTWHQFKALSYRITTNWLIEGTEDDEEFLIRVRRPTVTTDHPYFYIEVPDFRERAVVRITQYVSSTEVEGVLEDRLWSLPTSTDVWAFGSWSDKYGFPSVAAFYQERLVFANTPTDPQRIWMSRSGNYPDFGVSLPLQDDDAVDIPIPSREVNAITGIVPLTDLVVMSAGGQWKVGPGTSSEAITPSEKVAKPQNYTRSSEIPPLVVGNRVLFLEGMNAKVFDLGYSLEDDSYAGNDLSVLSEHLFDGHYIVGWAFQQAPYSVVWAVRDDGVLLGMTYLREHQVVAWHHHHTDGVVESICAIPGDGEDQLWAIVRRTINGATKRYVERLHSRRFTALEDAFFVDCGLTYSGTAATEITGLDHLEGKTVVALANGTVVRNLTVASGKVTLPTAATKAHVGLGYDCDLCTLEDAIELKDGVSIPKRKNASRAILMLNNSAGGQVGPDADHLNDLDYEGNATPFTGKLRPTLESGWDDEGKVYIRQSDPLPFGVDGIVRRVAYGG